MFELTWAKNGTPDTLTSATDPLTISDLGSNILNVVMFHAIEDSSATPFIQYNNATGSVYAQRESTGGVADATTINITGIDYALASLDSFVVEYLCFVSGEEKLGIGFEIDNYIAGAGTAPRRRESVHKYVTDSPLTRYDVTNSSGGNYAIGSNLSAIGTD